MPPYVNPVNDFYFRNAQQYGQQMLPFPPQQQFNFPPQQQNHPPAIHANWVTSIEEAKAAQLSDFVATNIYLDTGSGKIYLKRMGDNGKPQFLSYAIENDVTEKDPLGEINARLMNIENAIGGLRNESVQSNTIINESAELFSTAASKQNEPNGTAESTGFPKNAGNDQWKKRNRHETDRPESC